MVNDDEEEGLMCEVMCSRVEASKCDFDDGLREKSLPTRLRQGPVELIFRPHSAMLQHSIRCFSSIDSTLCTSTLFKTSEYNFSTI